MSRVAKQLSQRRFETLKTLGRHPDGGNLYLKIGKGGRRNWVFLYQRHGRRREMGLGPAGENDVGLGEARAYAEEARRLLREGKDPIDARAAKRAAEVAEGKNFRSVAELYLAAHEDTWKNPKHRAQWRATLETYAYSKLGARPLSEIDTGAVMDVLEPIWRDKTETATRVRGRIELILDYASARGWRTGENPARWRGHLDKLLPRPSKVAVVKHHAALPWQEIGTFMESLRLRKATAAQALDLLILTAARTSEVLGATWGEFDLAEGIWTIPAARMKAARSHRVPLSKPARAVLTAVKPDMIDPNAYVFMSDKESKPLSSMALLMLLRRMDRNDLTAHGFRSTFRTWAGETTAFAREVAEAALAHSIGDKTEAAYSRGDLFAKRARLMEEWAAFCGRKRAPAKVLSIGMRAGSAT